MLKKSIVLSLVTLLASCSTNYQVSTNLDKENFKNYFSAAEVSIYDTEQEITTRHKFVGLVEGQDCQTKSHQAAPDKIIARTQARQQAFVQGANAIVFSGCAVFSPEQLAQLSHSNDAKQCHAIVICYGRAFIVEADDSAK